MASRVSDHLQMGEGGPAKHSKQFVIDGNEFLIIETDNVLLASGTMKNGGSGALSKVSKFDFSYTILNIAMIMS